MGLEPILHKPQCPKTLARMRLWYTIVMQGSLMIKATEKLKEVPFKRESKQCLQEPFGLPF